MIPAQAVEVAAKAAYVQHSNEPGFNAAAAWDDMAGTDDWEREQWESTARAALEVAAPHMLTPVEDRLAAIVVALDPFERAASDEAKRRRAFESVLKIRAILDSK